MRFTARAFRARISKKRRSRRTRKTHARRKQRGGGYIDRLGEGVSKGAVDAAPLKLETGLEIKPESIGDLNPQHPA